MIWTKSPVPGSQLQVIHFEAHCLSHCSYNVRRRHAQGVL